MTKKKVTAPLTYNPGKGRPKEHLAYLNYQEMQALQRLNGEGPYKGPKGIPSFVLGGATTSGTAANRAMSSAAQSNRASASKPSGSSSVSRISGGTAGSNAARASSSGRPSGSGFSGIGSGGGGGRDSGQAANRPSSSPSRPSDSGGGGGRDSGQAANRPTSSSVSRISGGVAGSNRDSNVIRQAQLSNTRSAEKTPALRSDTQRTVNVGPMGTPVNVRPGGAPIRPSAPRPPVSTPMSTQGPSFGSPLDARIANRFAINDFKLQSGALGPEGVPSVSQIASENARRLNAARMAQQYSQYRSPPGVPPAAPQGVFGPRAGAGTGYLRTVEAPGMITTGMPSALSEMPRPRVNAEATLRAYEEEKRISNAKQITDRIPASKLYSGDRVPAEPRLSAGRSAVVPSYPVGPSTRPFVVTDPRVSLSPGTYAGAPMDKPRLTVGRSAINPMNSPVLLRSYEGGFGPELMGAAGSELERDLLTEYERNLQKAGVPSLGKTRGLGTSEKILEVEDYFTVPPRDPADVSEEMVPGFGIDVNNIPRVQVTFDPATNRPRPSSGYSGYGTFNVPDIVSPVIEGAPTGGKIFRDKVPGYDISGEPYNPSVVVGANGNTVAYKMTDAIASPPDPRSGVRALDAINDLRRTGAGTYTDSYDVPEERPGGWNPAKIAGYEVYNPADYEDSLAIKVPRWKQSPAYSFIGDSTSTGMPGDETPADDYTDDGISPSQEPAAPSQDIAITEEAEAEQEKNRKKAEAARRVAQGSLNLVAPGLGTLAGQGFKFLNASTQKLVDAYQSAGMTERKAMEEKYPNLIAHGKSMGLQTYYGMDKYNQWADRAGLRGPPTREGGPSGGASSGIGSLGGGEGGGQTTPPETPPSTPSTPSGARPEIYYMWDLGINIPSPGDPNYTLYQKYLVETLAAQQAAGYV